MSVGARSVFNAAYEPLLFDVVTVPFPTRSARQVSLDALAAACSETDRKPAAFIVEPLVLGAGGMHMYDEATLRDMAHICAQHDVLFIADEVMTGWGRTGARFACEKAGVVPDIACYAKGLTGGTLPLAATLCSARIFDAHWSTDRARTFFHSSSYTANPIACAAACANIEIWKTEPVLERISTLAELQSQHLAALTDLPSVTFPRQTGTIAAFDIAVAEQGYLSDLAPRMQRDFHERGILLRPLGSTVYIMPPYCTTSDDLDRLYAILVDYISKEVEV